MSRSIQIEQLPLYRERYGGRGREGKGKLLDELCGHYGYSRKHAIKLLTGKAGAGRQPRNPNQGRPCEYGEEELEVIKRIWLSGEQPCGKRLKAMLGLWLKYYDKPVSEETRSKLFKISAAQIDRLLSPLKARYPKRLCGTKPGTLIKREIPIKTDHWDVTQPGFMEADTVAHCGTSLVGDFVWSVVLTDIHTGWTSQRAVWNKGAQGVHLAIEDIEKNLPFAILGFDSDNGGEFINYHLLSYFRDRTDKPVSFTRSRPYHKNDNAHVEQKNYTHARQLLGYDRIEVPEAVEEINELYVQWGKYQNFFCANMKLKEKKREGSRWIKTYYPAQTSWQRLQEALPCDDARIIKFKADYEKLNPFTLKKEIEKRLQNLHKTLRRSSRPSGSLRSSASCGMPLDNQGCHV